MRFALGLVTGGVRSAEASVGFGRYPQPSTIEPGVLQRHAVQPCTHRRQNRHDRYHVSLIAEDGIVKIVGKSNAQAEYLVSPESQARRVVPESGIPENRYCPVP
ncbi:hypothetical protein GC170_13460 [bacterium]|nr:hypothetical protein [bacterium]